VSFFRFNSIQFTMMKKQRKSSSKWSESEIQVAEIIRDLYCISLLTSIPFSWGCKRKRSAIQSTPSPIIHNRRAVLPPPSTTVAVKTEARSPETPLSFPATESDDKPKHSSKKKTSLKRVFDSYFRFFFLSCTILPSFWICIMRWFLSFRFFVFL
jgi:hypothetical protein